MSKSFSVYVGGFGLSDSVDGPQSAINYNEVVVGKFLHIHVQTNLPEEIITLQGKFRKVTDGNTGDPADDRDLGVGRKIRSGQFEFILTHYILEEDATYLIRVADMFSGDTLCLGSSFIKTKRG